MKELFIGVGVILISLTSCTTAKSQQTEVKNIILLIGDGMGVGQIYAGMSVSKEVLNFERSQYFGYSKTHSATDYTTDSGAGATALCTGKKTYNTAIAVDTNKNELKTIVDYAHEAGLSTGIVASCALVHATPASFITHDTSRYNYIEIAKKFVDTDIDILIGGGTRYFDSLGVTDSLKSLGFQIQPDIKKIDVNSEVPVFSIPYFFHPPSILNGRGDFLPDATKIALQKLSRNKKGFFLMVEGSQIDWGGHDNDIDYVTSEVIDFDKVIGVAYDFADLNPGTLVIVLADHETGGLYLPNGSIKENTIDAAFSSINHTGIMIPIFAYGAGAEQFSAIIDNTEVFNIMMTVLDLQ